MEICSVCILHNSSMVLTLKYTLSVICNQCKWNTEDIASLIHDFPLQYAIGIIIVHFAIPLIYWQCNFNTEEIVYAPGRSLRVTVKPRDTEWTSFCSSLCAQQTEAFHLVDLGWLLHSHQLWQENMPHIKPYYGDYAVHTRLSACR